MIIVIICQAHVFTMPTFVDIVKYLLITASWSDLLALSRADFVEQAGDKST
jgi:hypothetical protein